MKKCWTTAIAASATTAVMLITAWPRETNAQEVAEWERQGEWDDDGMRFGNIVVRGDLVFDATVPGGWVVVRTLENKSDTRDKCTVEERVLRTETMPDARVEPPPFAVVDRMQTFELGPHEKRAIGVPLAEALGHEITDARKVERAVEAARERAIASQHITRDVFERTYMRYQVDYLKPLPPGATAAPTDNGVLHPAVMPMGAL